MACMKANGEGVEAPFGRFKQRGKNLSDVEIRRIRDLLLVLLVKIMRLSVDDVQAVFESAVRERQVRNIIRANPTGHREVTRQLRELLTGGGVAPPR
jgi:hypothetical protein